MERISVQIPGALYAAFYERFGDEATVKIIERLSDFDGVENSMAERHVSRSASFAYPRPGVGTITGRVWAIADEIQAKTGNADREEVIKACMAEGLNVNTASTQFSYWRKAQA